MNNFVAKSIRLFYKIMKTWKCVFIYHRNTRSTSDIEFITALKDKLSIEEFLLKVPENPIYFAPELLAVDSKLKGYLYKYGIFRDLKGIKGLFVVQDNGLILGPISLDKETQHILTHYVKDKFAFFSGKKHTGSFYHDLNCIDATLILKLRNFNLKNLNKGKISDVKFAEKNGLIFCKNNLDFLKDFWVAHRDHLRDKSYQFEYLSKLFAELNNIVSFYVTLKDNEFMSGCIIIKFGSRALYWLAATSDKGKKLRAQSFCVYATILDLKNESIEIFDFGGVGYPELNSWDMFKLHFGSELEIKYKL